MNEEICEQFSQECGAWLRELEFLLMEISFLKTRLSHVVDVALNRETVTEAESFQNSLIATEDMVRRLIAEVKFQVEQVSYLTGIEDVVQARKVAAAHEYLRSAVAKLESDFATLRREFNHWVIGNIRVG